MHYIRVHSDHPLLPSCWFSQSRGQCQGNNPSLSTFPFSAPAFPLSTTPTPLPMLSMRAGGAVRIVYSVGSADGRVLWSIFYYGFEMEPSTPCRQRFLTGNHPSLPSPLSINEYILTSTQLVSIFIFSWAYVMFIPSWVNEKKNDVSTNKVVSIIPCSKPSFSPFPPPHFLSPILSM